jgi:GxxExxY protein
MIKKVQKIAVDVYKTLGSGHPEIVYDKAMQVGFRLEKIKYESQKVIELKYKDHCIGEAYPDLVIHNGQERLVVELKAVGGQMGIPEEQQLKNYLKILNFKEGLLINFQQPGKRDGNTEIEFREVFI